MKANPIYPIAALHGSLTKNYYCRICNGKLIIQRKPKRLKPPTEKQLAARRAFAEKQKRRHEENAKERSGIVVVTG